MSQRGLSAQTDFLPTRGPYVWLKDWRVRAVLILFVLGCGGGVGSGAPGGSNCSFKRPAAMASDTTVRFAADERFAPPVPKPKPKKLRKVNCTKQNSRIWKKTRPFRDQYHQSADGKEVYLWDNTHNDIEVWRKSTKKHLGSMDPEKGELYKGPDPRKDFKGKKDAPW